MAYVFLHREERHRDGAVVVKDGVDREEIPKGSSIFSIVQEHGIDRVHLMRAGVNEGVNAGVNEERRTV